MNDCHCCCLLAAATQAERVSATAASAVFCLSLFQFLLQKWEENHGILKSKIIIKLYLDVFDAFTFFSAAAEQLKKFHERQQKRDPRKNT